jgi:hypothetical protein
MTDAVLLLIVLGTVALALAVDVTALVAWLAVRFFRSPRT